MPQALPKVEGRYIDPYFLGKMEKGEVLYHFDSVDLIYTTTLPSGHRAFVFWSDCTEDSKYDRYHVYVFRDTRFDWAYGRMQQNELILPILEEADWIYSVDMLNTKEGSVIEKTFVVDWAHLNKDDIPTNEARLYTEEEYAAKVSAATEGGALDSGRREAGVDGAGLSVESANG